MFMYSNHLKENEPEMTLFKVTLQRIQSSPILLYGYVKIEHGYEHYFFFFRYFVFWALGKFGTDHS